MNSNTFGDTLAQAIKAVGKDLGDDLDTLKLYAAQRAVHLSLIVGEPGYEEAVMIEAQNVALKAGILTVETADATDARVVGVIQGALRIGAVALA